MATPWFVNIDQKKASDPHWLGYSTADAKKIEAAYQKKSDQLILNSDYLIDFGLMRQVRREDSDRWRLIKRGGAATDPAPVPADEEIDEEEAEALAKRQQAASIADVEDEDTAAVPSPKKIRDRAMTAAIAPLPPASAALSAASIATSPLVLSLQAQLAEVEAELAKSEADREIAVKKLEVAAAKSAALRADLLNSETDRELLQQKYVELAEAIRPMVVAMGLNSSTPVGKCMALYEKEQAGSAGEAAAAAPSKAPSKKRSQEDEAKTSDDTDKPLKKAK